MIAILLMLCVAAGIAYPFVQKSLGLRREPETLDAAETATTARIAASREELCPSCSRLNPAERRTCIECGAAMPVASFNKLFAGTNQEDLLREGVQAGVLLAVMLLAMAIASFLPIGGKILLMLLTVTALGYRFFRVLVN